MQILYNFVYTLNWVSYQQTFDYIFLNSGSLSKSAMKRPIAIHSNHHKVDPRPKGGDKAWKLVALEWGQQFLFINSKKWINLNKIIILSLIYFHSFFL